MEMENFEDLEQHVIEPETGRESKNEILSKEEYIANSYKIKLAYDNGEASIENFSSKEIADEAFLKIQKVLGVDGCFWSMVDDDGVPYYSVVGKHIVYIEKLYRDID